MKKFLLTLSSILFCTNAFGWTAVGDNVASAYGYNTDVHDNDSVPYIIAGGKGKMSAGVPNETTSYGMVAIFAYNHLTLEGAMLCPMQVECDLIKDWSPWRVVTTYYRPANLGEDWLNTNCLHLCKEGYTYKLGNGCIPIATITSGETIDFDNRVPEVVFKTNSPTITTKTTANLEADHKLFSSGYEVLANDQQKQWDNVLAVSRFIPHGVMVKPFYLKCRSIDYPNNNNYIEVLQARSKEETILCMMGYQPNTDKTACVLIDASKSVGAITTCGDGSKKYGFNEKGECITCPNGKLFSDEKHDCVQAIALSKTDMLYGKGKTKSDVMNNKPCWVYAEPQQYKECVMNAAASD